MEGVLVAVPLAGDTRVIRATLVQPCDVLFIALFSDGSVGGVDLGCVMIIVKACRGLLESEPMFVWSCDSFGLTRRDTPCCESLVAEIALV